MKGFVFTALILLFFLNIIDAFATYHWVTNGIASEENPLMSVLFEWSPWAFLLMKIVIGSWCVWFLLKRKRRPLIEGLIFLTLGVYLYATALHCQIALKVF